MLQLDLNGRLCGTILQLMNSKLKVFSVLSFAVFSFYTIWWILLRLDSAPEALNADAFSDTYGILALIAGVAGIGIAKEWGGFKSLMGKAVMFFSFGLLAQAFGQFVYSIYFFLLDKEVPYPSIGDIGYFGSVLLYIYAIYCLARVSGAHITLKSFGNKIFALLIPATILGFSYYMFLRDYEVDTSMPVATFLDFGYPLGQAIYIAIAILTYTLSRRILGGIMKSRILFVLAALVAQYIADFVFLYQASHETWEAGGINDFTYLLAYFLMGLALLGIGRAYKEIKE